MKKLYFPLIIALVTGFVSSCSLEAPAAGHLAITVPYSFSSSGTKAISSRSIAFASGTSPYIRIYVLLNGSFVKLASNGASGEYAEQSLATSSNLNSTSYSVDLPASTGYKVYTVLGTKDSNGLWTPKYYGGSDTFAVSAGVLTNESISVSAPTFAVPFSPSSSATYAAVVGGTLWQIVGGSLTNGTKTVPLSSYGTIYSLTAGRWFSGPEPWVNTSTGIWAFTGSSSLTKRSSVAATYSGAFVADIDSSGTSSLVLYYYGSDVGFASSSDTTLSTADSFTKSGSLSSFLKSSSGSSFADLIKDPSTFLTAAAIVVNGTSSYGFVSTALGSFLYNTNVQNSMGTDVLTWLKSQITSSPYAFAAYDSNGKSVQIKSFALNLDLSNTGAPPTTLYAGTDAGLYSTTNITNAATLTSAPTLTSISSGIKIQKLAAASLNGSSYYAYVDGDGNLTISGGAAPISYPFYAFTASPSSVQSLTFYVDSSNHLDLSVASSDGLAVLTVK